MAKYAYADPPYIGQAKKRYAHDENCSEVNHKVLIQTMCREYDGWALSCSSPSLKEILSYCPKDIRVAAWVKPFCVFKPNVNPAYAWEPVVFWRPRRRSRKEETVRDWLSENITLKKGLCGAKPEAFCIWIFRLLGLDENDTLEDLFPGTGIVGHMYNKYKAHIRLRRGGHAMSEEKREGKIYYVNPYDDNASDDNDGLSVGTPFKTLGHAVNMKGRDDQVRVLTQEATSAPIRQAAEEMRKLAEEHVYMPGPPGDSSIVIDDDFVSEAVDAIRTQVERERERCMTTGTEYLCYKCERDFNNPCNACRKLKLAIDRIRQGGA